MLAPEINLTLSIVVGTLVLLIVGVALITAIVISQRRLIAFQRQTLTEIEKSERKYKDLFTDAIEGIYQSTPDGRYIDVNPALARIYGYSSPDAMMAVVKDIGQQLYYDPNRRADFMRQIEKHGEVRNFEYEARRKDGGTIWISANARSVRNADGDLMYEGTVQDITERKRTEEMLRHLPGRVLEAQESERKRIARELHDSVGQMLSAAKMRIHALTSGMGLLQSEVPTHLDQVRSVIQRAIEEVRRISHNLRPSELDDFGLLPALQSLCEEFQEHAKIRTILTQPTHIFDFPDDVNLTAYRVVQEALNNAEKYAQASSVTVEVTADGSSLHIRIKDDGRGFDPSGMKPSRQGGFGLMGMVERVGLVGGNATVESTIGRGTTISVRIPVASTEERRAS